MSREPTYVIRSPSGEVVLTGWVLLDVRGWKVTLHRMTAADAPGCFHDHPAERALRVVLWGGYEEELVRAKFRFEGEPLSEPVESQVTEMHRWWPGGVGWVRHDTEHRIHRLLNGRSSWGLWLRSPRIKQAVNTRGC